MKFISRTLTGLACAAGLAFGLPAQAAEKVNIGIVTAPNFVHTIAALKFKEELDKALPGKYDVIVHHSAALGSETQVLQQLQLGTVQMSVCTTGPVESFVPEIKALELPFLFSSSEASDKVLDGPIGQELLKRFDPHHGVAHPPGDLARHWREPDTDGMAHHHATAAGRARRSGKSDLRDFRRQAQ